MTDPGTGHHKKYQTRVSCCAKLLTATHTHSCPIEITEFSRALTFSAHQLGGVLVGAKLAATRPVATDHILRLDGDVTLGGRRARFFQRCKRVSSASEMH